MSCSLVGISQVSSCISGWAFGLAAPVLLIAAPAPAQVPVERLDFQLSEIGASIAVTEATSAEPAGQPVRLPPDLRYPAGEYSRDADDKYDRDWLGRDTQTRLSFRQHVGSIKWELAGAFAYMTAVNLAKMATRDSGFDGFKFTDEGTFGKDTARLGVDKLAHAHNTHMLTDILAARIRNKTGTTRGTAQSGAVLASGLMLYSEFYDGFKTGFGFQDLAFNTIGAGFSILRETTPGLEEKLDFRVLVIPNSQIYSPTGAEHYNQLRYMFAIKPSGFKKLKDTPLRYLELHAGYYATGLSDDEEPTQERRERKLFAGIGINVSEILFGRRPRSKAGRAGQELLDYWQPPYTYVHVK